MNKEELEYCEEMAKRVYSTHEHPDKDCWRAHPAWRDKEVTH